jgi:hypothetical protein
MLLDSKQGQVAYLTETSTQSLQPKRLIVGEKGQVCQPKGVENALFEREKYALMAAKLEKWLFLSHKPHATQIAYLVTFRVCSSHWAFGG